MESVTGLTGFDWALASLYGLLVAFIGGAFLWRCPGARIRAALVVPLGVGIGGVGLVAASFARETAFLVGNLPSGAATIATAVACLIGVTFADFLMTRLARPLGRLGTRRSRRAADVWMVAVLSAALVTGVVGLAAIDRRAASGYELARAEPTSVASVIASYSLPGQPMDIEFRTRSEAFVSLGDGRIMRLTLPEDGRRLRIQEVAAGLQSPRGLAISGSLLVVAELGELPCEQVFPCKGEHVPNSPSVEEGERRILRESRGRIVALDIAEDGSLSTRRVLLRNLPVANTDHGVNAVERGPDGRLYVAIGHLDRLAAATLTAADRSRPNYRLLGSVISMQPTGRDVRIVATGLRNVYDIAFDSSGRLYGVDNNGTTSSGWRHEEVLQIQPGDDFGYPDDGTFGPYERRTTPALGVLRTAGSAGIHAIPTSAGVRLVVGSCSDVYSVHLRTRGKKAFVSEADSSDHLMAVPGCVTAVKHVGAGVLAMTVFSFSGRPQLYLVQLRD